MPVKYRDWVLSKNSYAYELFQKKEFKALDKHLKELHNTAIELQTRYDLKEIRNAQDGTSCKN